MSYRDGSVYIEHDLYVNHEETETLTRWQNPIIEKQNKEIERLREENNFLKQLIPNDKKYSYGIRMGSDKE